MSQASIIQAKALRETINDVERSLAYAKDYATKNVKDGELIKKIDSMQTSAKGILGHIDSKLGKDAG